MTNTVSTYRFLHTFKGIFSLLIIVLLATSCGSSINYEDPHFIRYNASIYGEKDSTYAISIAYLIKKNKKDSLNIAKLENIKFKDNNIITITKHRFYDSDSTEDFSIVNIELEMEFAEVGEATTTELTFEFNDGTSKDFSIGDWYFHTDRNHTYEKSPLTMEDDYAVVSAIFDAHLINLKNNSDQELIINEYLINLSGVTMESTELEIKPQDDLRTVLPIQSNTASNKFYIIRPQIIYTQQDKVYHYYPYASLYGVINLTEEDFHNEYNR